MDAQQRCSGSRITTQISFITTKKQDQEAAHTARAVQSEHRRLHFIRKNRISVFTVGLFKKYPLFSLKTVCAHLPYIKGIKTHPYHAPIFLSPTSVPSPPLASRLPLTTKPGCLLPTICLLVCSSFILWVPRIRKKIMHYLTIYDLFCLWIQGTFISLQMTQAFFLYGWVVLHFPHPFMVLVDLQAVSKIYLSREEKLPRGFGPKAHPEDLSPTQAH